MILIGLKKYKKELEKTNSKELELLTLSIIIFAMTLPFSILYQPDRSELIENDIKSAIAYREFNAVMILVAGLYNNKRCKQAVIWDICHQNLDESQAVYKEIDVKRIKADKDIKLTEFTAYIREIFINCKRLYYQVNKISDIDFYLENYIKVILYIRSEPTVGI